MTMITDGTGSNYRAKVTDGNRLQVAAVVEDEYVSAASEGRAFNLNTERVFYTGTGPFETGCLYVKNNGKETLEIVGWFIGEFNDRVGGNTSDALLFTMYGNPTGTIAGDVATPVNRQIGSAKTFDVEALSSPTGWTVTGSPLLYQVHYGGRAFGTVNFTIPSGQSILLSVTSPTDSFSAYTGFTGYIRD